MKTNNMKTNNMKHIPKFDQIKDNIMYLAIDIDSYFVILKYDKNHFKIIETNNILAGDTFYLDIDSVSKYKETHESFSNINEYAVYEIGHINDHSEYFL